MAYRYWCGDCGFKTSWGPESQGAEQHLKHYASRHPVSTWGQVEINSRNPRGIGCAQIAGLIILLLIIVASCQR
ncbi:hypothetical protein NKH18_18835 [Streptomyces sp. M10(2022)]